MHEAILQDRVERTSVAWLSPTGDDQSHTEEETPGRTSSSTVAGGMTASLAFVLSTLLVVGGSRPTEVQYSSNITVESSTGNFLVLFKLGGNEQSEITSKDVEMVMDELKAKGPYFNFSECLRQRKEWGVQSCRLTTPCLNLKLFTTNYYDEWSDGIKDNDGHCYVLLHWLQDMKFATETSSEYQKPSIIEVWGYGILTSTLISLSGISGILCYPVMKRGYFKEVMNVLMGLAFGSLSSTAILQLIPETFNIKEYDENYLSKALICWSSIWLFYLVGVAVNIVNEHNKQQNKNQRNKLWQDEPHTATQPLRDDLEMTVSRGVTNAEEERNIFNAKVEAETKQLEEYPQISTKSTAGMILFGDGLHNFVDGMSIGAGFTQSLTVGFSISIGIACEEFPHELGDFAVLIRSGYSFKKALKLNYASASTIFLGVVLGILLGQIHASVYIYAISAGVFLYISLGELIPELKEMVTDMQVNGIRYGIIAFSLQNIGILTGAIVIYMVAYYT